MLTIYIASSFKHLHAVQLLVRTLREHDCRILDWTEKAVPPEGLNAAARREWMDTDHGGEVFAFCATACKQAQLVIYLGTSGQDAGVEVGIAHGAGIPILGIRGPLESPGLMLYGAVTRWVDNIGDAIKLVAHISASADHTHENITAMLCQEA